MAVDRLGNAVATGQVYALAGTARFVDGDDVVLVVGDRGEHALRCKAGDIVKVDDTTAGGGGGGAPTGAEYVVKSADAGLSNERVLTNSLSIEWNWTIAGFVGGDIPASYVALLALIYQPRNSLLDYISASGVDSNMIVDGSIATVDLGNGIVTNAKLASMTGPTVKGRETGTGDPADLSMSQLRGILTSGTPDGTKFLRDDWTWQAAPGGGGGGIEIGVAMSLAALRL